MNDSQAAGETSAETGPSIPTLPMALVGIIAALALGALGISSFLLLFALTGESVPGCGPSSPFGCSVVLTSRWSQWLTLPVSLPAIVVDLLLLFFLAATVRAKNDADRKHAWNILIIVGSILIGAGVWFIAIQALILKQFCVYCLFAHGFGIVAGLMLIFSAPAQAEWFSRMAIGVVVLAVLVAGQVMYVPPTIATTEFAGSRIGHQPDGNYWMLDGKLVLNPNNYPIIGDPKAETIFIYLFDYTCPHCHEQYHNLTLARKRYGDKLAYVKLPVPMDSKCNRMVTETREAHTDACALAKLALAVYHVDPTKFAEYDAFNFSSGKPRPVPEARAEAERLVGVDKLAQALADPWIQEQIERDIGLYDQTSKWANYRAIPQIITPSMIIAGQPGTPDELFVILEKNVGLVPVEGAEPLNLPEPATGEAPPMPPAPPSTTISSDDNGKPDQNSADGGT